MTKKKRLSPSEWLLKQSKRHKRKNTLYTAIVLLVALVLLIFAVKSIQVEPVKSDTRDKDSIRITYLGNVTLNKHIRQTNLNDVFKGIQDTLDHSDFSIGSLIVNDFSRNQKDNINKNIENIMFLRKHNVKSVNLINESMDNIQATAMMRKIDSQAGYN
ncbi:CapA family protein, partial [Paraburkholderia tropica]